MESCSIARRRNCASTSAQRIKTKNADFRVFSADAVDIVAGQLHQFFFATNCYCLRHGQSIFGMLNGNEGKVEKKGEKVNEDVDDDDEPVYQSEKKKVRIESRKRSNGLERANEIVNKMRYFYTDFPDNRTTHSCLMKINKLSENGLPCKRCIKEPSIVNGVAIS